MPSLEINVIFGMQTVTPPIQGSVPTSVSPDPIPSHSNATIMWTFQTLDPQISSVELEFVDAKDTFFGASASLKKALSGGTTTMWGTAPHIKNGVRPSKYVVRAYDSSGAAIPLYELDPTVVTVDP